MVEEDTAAGGDEAVPAGAAFCDCGGVEKPIEPRDGGGGADGA